VKADAILTQLLALRRLGEQRALETLHAREGELRRAQRAVDDASADATRHLAETNAHERKQIESFAGQPVPESTIRRFRANLDALIDKQQRLRAAGETARQALTERLDALRHAQASLQLHQRAVAKFDHLAKQQSARTALRQAAQAEAADEERIGRCRSLPTSDGN
jgi:Type III secretion protein YscO